MADPLLLLVNPSEREKSMKRKRKRKVKPRRTKISRARPRKRKSPRRTATKTVIRYRNPRKRKSSRRRRVVRGSRIMRTLTVSATAASGAVLLDIMMGYIKDSGMLPADMDTGPMSSILQGMGALGLGMVAEKIVSKRVAEQVIIGGMTVTMYGVIKQLVSQQLPNVPGLDGLGYYSPAPVTEMGALDMDVADMGVLDMGAGAGVY